MVNDECWVIIESRLTDDLLGVWAVVSVRLSLRRHSIPLIRLDFERKEEMLYVVV